MTTSPRLLIAVLAIAALALPTAAAAAGPCKSKKPTAHRTSIKVHGKKSKAFVSFPKRKPRALVVVAHGYSWTAAAWKSKLRLIAKQNRAIAVAPEFRGLRLTTRQYG